MMKGDFKDRLVEAIRASGKTQGQIAAEIGTHANQVTEWVTGKRKPHFDHLVALAKVLDIDLNWLAMGRGEAVEPVNELADRLRGVGPELVALVRLAEEN